MNSLQSGVGILGGTFNPVHNGHVRIARSFLNSGYLRSLQILLNPAPPHKEEQNMASYALRLQMLQAAFTAFDDAVVSDLETRLPAPAYTVQTLLHLKASNPGEIFYLCIGADSLASFESWHRWRKILDLCHLLVARRPGISESEFNAEVLQKTVFVDHRPVGISSTQIRHRISRGESVKDLLPQQVWAIIKQEELYQKKPT